MSRKSIFTVVGGAALGLLIAAGGYCGWSHLPQKRNMWRSKNLFPRWWRK